MTPEECLHLLNAWRRSTDLTNKTSTTEGFAFLERKFFGGCEMDRGNRKLVIREKHEHAFLFDAPCKIVVRKKASGDMLIAGLAPPSLFISDALLTTFLEEGITGFEAVEADVRLAFPHDPSQSKYWQLVTTGWGGVASPRSGIEELEQGRFGQRKYSPCSDPRLILDPSQYDGSDLFLVWPLPWKIWVSPRLSRLLAERRVKHFGLDAIESYRFEQLADDPVGFGPLPLECYLPQDRATEVGSAHGIDWFEFTKPPYPTPVAKAN